MLSLSSHPPGIKDSALQAGEHGFGGGCQFGPEFTVDVKRQRRDCPVLRPEQVL